MPLPHPVLFAGGRPVAVLIADTTGAEVSGTVVPEVEVIDVREPATVVAQLDALEREYAATLDTNEVTVAPRLVRMGTQSGNLDIRMAESTYARFLAAASWIGGLPIDEQVRELTHYSTGTPPWLSHSFGINCSLETSDGNVVFTRRTETTHIEPERLAPIMGEGANAADIINGSWDPLTTARRGFHEELGFALDADEATLSITLHSLIAQFGNGGISLCGHATTSLTLNELLEQLHQAFDAAEHAAGLYVVNADLEPFNAFLEAHPFHEWTTWGAVTVWQILTHRFGVTHPALKLQTLTDTAQVS